MQPYRHIQSTMMTRRISEPKVRIYLVSPGQYTSPSRQELVLKKSGNLQKPGRCFHVSLTLPCENICCRGGYGNTGTVSCSMGVINCLVRQQFIYTRLLLVICGPCCHKSRSLALQMSAALSFAGLHSIINIKTQRSS